MNTGPYQPPQQNSSQSGPFQQPPMHQGQYQPPPYNNTQYPQYNNAQPLPYYNNRPPFHPGQFQPPPYPPYNMPPPQQRQRGFRPWFKRQTRGVKIGLICSMLIGILSLCLCILILFAAVLTPMPTTHNSSQVVAIATTPTQVPTVAATPQPKHFGQSVDQIVKGLQAHGLPIGVYFTYTDANDVNHLLGRPGQYIGKLNFKDTRITSADQGADITVSDGGSIEVFATVSDAMHRFTYLQSLSTTGNALFAEYEYLGGVAILRVSAQLTPTQAKAYEKALQELP